jgi:hypothetical protein
VKTDLDEEIARYQEELSRLLELKRATVEAPSSSTPQTPSTARRPLASVPLASVPLAPVSAPQPPLVKRTLAFHPPEQVKAPQVGASPASLVSSDVHGASLPGDLVSSSRQRPLKGKEPEKFGGSEQERVSARRWLRTARNWLKLAARGEDEGTVVDMFATLLKDAAGDWFYHLQETTERKGRELTLQTVFDEFVLKFEGGVSRVLLQQELDGLTYRKGKCKDIYATDAEFDRLVGMLYPDVENDDPTMPLLGKTYADIFRRGDLALWAEAVRMAPTTVDEWKAAIQRAHTMLQIFAAAAGQGGRLGGGSFGSRPFSFSGFPSSSSTSSAVSSSASPRTPAVSIHEMQGRFTSGEETGETWTWERQEGEEESKTEQLQQVTVKQGQKTSSSAGNQQRGASGGAPRRRLGSHLTVEERVGLFKANRCWNCLEKGHVAIRCPSLDKPGFPRKPGAEHLLKE